MAGGSWNRFLFMLCLVLLGSATIQTCKGDTGGIQTFKKRRVSIHNAIKGFALQVHCKSANDDLGVQRLAPGETYEWSFHVNWKMTTLFSCDLSCVFGRLSYVAYHADNTDFEDCGPGNRCQWQAGEFGVQFWNDRKGKWTWPRYWDVSKKPEPVIGG